MPIYDIFEAKDTVKQALPARAEIAAESSKKERFFSSLTARLLFFLLLIGDLVWVAYAVTLFVCFFTLHLVTWFKLPLFGQLAAKQWLAIKRAAICAIALLVSLFSPALGIMVACTYFLMYDKTGIQEVIPSSLQEQFQEFMK